MIHHASTVLAAAAAAALPPPIPLPAVRHADVDEAIARLPAKAREGRRMDPGAVAFSVGSWDALHASHASLFVAVANELERLGLEVSLGTLKLGGRELPTELFVSYESLAAAAERIHATRETWLATAREAWTVRFGEAGAIDIERGPFGDILALIGPEPATEDTEWLAQPGRMIERPAWRSGTDFYDHPPAELVRAALAAFQIPLWSFDVVAKLWAENTGGDVQRSRGLWTKDGMLPGPTILFRLDATEKTYAVEDVFALTAEAFVDEVLRDPVWSQKAEGPPEAVETEAEDDASTSAAGASPPKASAAPRAGGAKLRAHGERR